MIEQTTKPFKTIEELIEIFKERGCIISDVSSAHEILSKINYYRLTAYLLPFKDTESKEERYLPNTRFEKIVSLHEFDRKLRSLLLQAIDFIEITLRARISYTHVKNHDHDPIAYLKPENFNYVDSEWLPKKEKEKKVITKEEKQEEFQKTIENIILNNEKDDIIKHHNSKYGGKLPLWVIIQFFTFGDLSRFYSNLDDTDQKEIADQFIHECANINENSRHKFLKSWLRCCADVRNRCAHFGVLYGRPFPFVPKGFNPKENVSTSLWAIILVIKRIHPFPDKWNKEFIPQLRSLIASLEESDLERLCFPENWEEELKI